MVRVTIASLCGALAGGLGYALGGLAATVPSALAFALGLLVVVGLLTWIETRWSGGRGYGLALAGGVPLFTLAAIVIAAPAMAPGLPAVVLPAAGLAVGAAIGSVLNGGPRDGGYRGLLAGGSVGFLVVFVALHRSLAPVAGADPLVVASGFVAPFASACLVGSVAGWGSST